MPDFESELIRVPNCENKISEISFRRLPQNVHAIPKEMPFQLLSRDLRYFSCRRALLLYFKKVFALFSECRCASAIEVLPDNQLTQRGGWHALISGD